MSLFLFIAAVAAAPAVAQQVVAPPASDPLTPLYILVGTSVLAQVAGMIVAFVKWMGSRTVQREDKDKEEIQKRLDEHDEKFDEQDRAVGLVDKAVSSVQVEMKQVLSTVETTKGMVIEIKGAMDNRFEKQADFYRQQVKELKVDLDKRIEDLEYKLRQDMTRAVHDASLMSRAAPKKNRKS